MENLLESNERTLDIFDSVCTGLASCLALVHADIRQMIEHRDQLTRQLAEQQQQREASASDGRASADSYAETDLNYNEAAGTNCDETTETSSSHGRAKQTDLDASLADSVDTASSRLAEDALDPHHLAHLKLLDKRLADSFSQALSMCDQQHNKSSMFARKNLSSRSRPHKQSLLLALLGKGHQNKRGHERRPEDARDTGPLRSGEPAPMNGGADQFKADSRAVIDDINRQTRLAMQYSKQLEAHLFKVEDLRAKYEMHLKMGLATTGTLASVYKDGAASNKRYQISDQHGMGMGGLLVKSASYSSLKRASKNYNKSSLGHSQRQLNGTKTTIKEFIDNIERIETDFESHMGSFLLNIEDIQGFARVCQGDVFEINIKYGDSQKFKSKISVLKDNSQKCDHKQSVFKARIADVIAIKAYECKGLGKRVLLGHKLCETRDLFTARSQLMTISLNQTGSIKLNLIITWNPLHMTPKGHDISHVSPPLTPVSSSTLSSLSSARSSMNGVSAIATENNTTLINIQANNNTIGRKHKLDSPSQSEHMRLMDKCPECAVGFTNLRCHQPNRIQRPHSMASLKDRPKLYQDAEAIYSYHIPEPDYLISGDVKY